MASKFPVQRALRAVTKVSDALNALADSEDDATDDALRYRIATELGRYERALLDIAAERVVTLKALEHAVERLEINNIEGSEDKSIAMLRRVLAVLSPLPPR